MAPIPRKRIKRDEDEENIVESASSSFQPAANRKRARVSRNPTTLKSQVPRGQSPSTSSSAEDEEDEDEGLPDAEDVSIPPPSTQYELIRDNGFEHLKDTERDDQRAAQRFLARNQQIGDNHAANNAIIQEITCINFMCHDRLNVALGPLINFIVGKNGAGKSAVLTGITLCLGGKASSTNRGQSLKTLIKEGKDQAMLIVKLKNEGADAYQPDVYGKSIIIERQFSRSGSSGFKLKSESGRTISAKKGDVDDIIEYFQLQVDNPMNVLTQDAAKSFITSSTPAQKYKFFVEGVQLQALDNDYRLVSDTCDQIEEKLNDAKDDIKALKKNAEAAHAKSEVVRQHDGMRKEAKRLAWQSAWAQVAEEEKDLAERAQMIISAQTAVGDAEAVAEDKSQVLQQFEDQLERIRETESQLAAELVPLTEEEAEAKDARDAAVQELTKAHNKQKDMGKDLKTVGTKIQRLEEQIEEEKKRMEDANGGAHSHKLAEIKDAEQAAADAHTALEKHEGETAHLEATRKSTEEKIRELTPQLTAKRRDVDAANERLETVNQNRGNILAGYDARMPRLLEQIRRDKGFREMPIGPLGRCIKLLKPVWSNVLEIQMSSVLQSFIVTSKPDQVRLSKLLRDFNMGYCQVAIVNHGPLDTTGHEPDPQYDTVLRVLDIENELVRKHLVISQAIDQSILIENRSDAMRVMFEGPKPQNVTQCFCLHESRPGWGMRLAYVSRNSQSREIGPVAPPKVGGIKSKMRTDIESQILAQREVVRQVERDRDAFEEEFNRVSASLNRCVNTIAAHKKETGRLRIRSQKAQDRVDELTSELESLNVEDGRLDGLKQSLAEEQQEQKIKQETYGSLGLEKEAFNTQSQEKKQEWKAVKDRLDEHEAKLNKTQQRLKKVDETRKHALLEKNLAFTHIEEFRKEVESAKRRHERQAERVANFIEQASKVCDRIPIDPGVTPKDLDARLTKLNSQLELYRARQGGEDHEIYDAEVEAHRVYEAAKASRTNLEELLALLKQTFLKRMEMFRRFQSSISARSRINFNYLLSERTFRGKLDIDHINKKLDVHVEPDETVKGSKGRQTKTLSGGEKSFSNICLLLSLWEAMGAPLRCLDEYDVFMDQVNRDVSSRMIISAARRSVGRQFIMITPNNLGNGASDGGADVKVTMLKDPREKQTTLDDMIVDS